MFLPIDPIFVNHYLSQFASNQNFPQSMTMKCRQQTVSPKHLGVTFASDGNWTVHIENIATSALKQVNVLRKLKCILSKQALSNIYLTFIIPVLEYAYDFSADWLKFPIQSQNIMNPY
jgi:hypothetical protein